MTAPPASSISWVRITGNHKKTKEVFVWPLAFSDCPNLEKLAISAPADSVFEFPRNCPNLKILLWNVDKPSFNDPERPVDRTYPKEFKCVLNNCFLFVPKKSLSLYRKAWRYGDPNDEKAFKDILPLEDYYSEAYKEWNPTWIVPKTEGVEKMPVDKSQLYDIQGRKMQQTPQRGLYIRDGKKRVVK